MSLAPLAAVEVELSFMLLGEANSGKELGRDGVENDYFGGQTIGGSSMNVGRVLRARVKRGPWDGGNYIASDEMKMWSDRKPDGVRKQLTLYKPPIDLD